MGKNLIQQARGKGGPTYRSPSFRFRGVAEHKPFKTNDDVAGTIIDLLDCPGHSAPLVLIKYDDGEDSLTIAPEGISVGQRVKLGNNTPAEPGNTCFLKDLAEGTLINNIESQPGDGGKFVRGSGTFARVVLQKPNAVVVMLPSKKQREFLPFCRAGIGIVAGAGRVEKPFVKAGVKYYAKKAKNKIYPVVAGSAQNAVDHPFGNKRTSRKSKARPTSRNAPPGRKVGMIAARRTGRKKK